MLCIRNVLDNSINYDVGSFDKRLLGRYCSFPPELLCGISLGMNISAAHMNIVVNWATNRVPPLRVYEGYENTKQFGVGFRWIA